MIQNMVDFDSKCNRFRIEMYHISIEGKPFVEVQNGYRLAVTVGCLKCDDPLEMQLYSYTV